MNLKSSNKIETNRRELEIEISAEEFGGAVDKAYNKQKSKITIPGFRKGKASRSFIEKYYGEKAFFEDAINDIYPEAIDFAAKEAKLEIIDDHIDFDLVEAEKEKGLTFKVKVTVMPEVAIENYKGIEIEKKTTEEVTEKDIEKSLNEIRERNARYSYVEDDTTAKMTDMVNIDFEGFYDGKAFEGGLGEAIDLTLGRKQFIEGFEEQIVGHKTGEDFEIQVKFPENYHAANLAGKEATFKIHINSIQKCELPEIDDEFAKDVSEFDTLEEYKTDLKNKLVETKAKESEQATTDEIFKKFNDLVKVEIPEALIKNKIKELVYDYEQRLGAQGIKFKDFVKYTGATSESIDKMFRPQAETLVKSDLGLKKVAELENIQVTTKDIEKDYQEIATMYKMDTEKVKKFVPEEEVKNTIVKRKTIELIKTNAIIK